MDRDNSPLPWWFWLDCCGRLLWTFIVLLFTKISPSFDWHLGHSPLCVAQDACWSIYSFFPFCGVTRPRLFQSDVFFLSFVWLLRAEQTVRFFWRLTRVVWYVYQTIPWDQTVLWHGSLSFFLPSLLVLSLPFLIFQAHFNFVTFKSCPVKFGFKDCQSVTDVSKAWRQES